MKCDCGAGECWNEHDTAWLGSESGWYGDVDGCHTSIFFIHGKKIREQRSIPEQYGSVDEFIAKLRRWSIGLDNAHFIYTHDVGDGSPGTWIEGTREPHAEDTKRLVEARARIREQAQRDVDYKLKQIAAIDSLNE